MLNIHGGGARLCDGLTRREVLRIGGLGAFGLTLPQLLRRQARASTPTRPRGNDGRPGEGVHRPVPHGRPAPAFDLGPQARAPAEVRGEFKPIATTVPGLSVCELMPRTALRRRQGLRPAGRVHRRQRPLVQRLLHADRPPAPAEELRERQSRAAQRRIPAWAASSASCGKGRGGLPPRSRFPTAFSTPTAASGPARTRASWAATPTPGCSRSTRRAEGFRIQEIDLPADVSPTAWRAVGSLLQQLDRRLDAVDAKRAARPLRRAEPAKPSTCSARPSPPGIPARTGAGGEARALRAKPVRPRRPAGPPAGRGRCQAGAGQLVSRPRRAVRQPLLGQPRQGERAAQDGAGAADRSGLLGPAGRPGPARGLLDETLVVCMAEFGRTPRLDGNGGRDHWG